ncbi:MAG: aspartate kinase [Bacteroidales bacterium]|nr:aspartate kinase [Bacteroidales bacterium]
MQVIKFGGTSIGNPEQIRIALSIIDFNKDNIVVLSAFSGVTATLCEFIRQANNSDFDTCKKKKKKIEDKHISFTNELLQSSSITKIALNQISKSIHLLEKFISRRINSINEKEILAQGELLSAKIIYLYLLEREIDVALLPALNFMRLNSKKDPDLTLIKKRLSSELKKYTECRLFLTNGFICKNHRNKVDNLGRGGSDYTATIIGNVINASVVEIWTDIDGLHNNDPRFVDNTQAIRNISYNEACELAYFGAKILHPSSITPAQSANIPLIIKNTLNPNDKGTVISEYTIPKAIKAISAKDDISTIKVKSGRMMQAYGFLRKVFEIFEKYETPVDMLTTSEISVAMTIDNNEYLDKIKTELQTLGEVEIETNQSIICVVGDFSKNNNKLIQLILDALVDIPVQMISFGASNINISLVVDAKDKVETLNILNHILQNELCLTEIQ